MAYFVTGATGFIGTHLLERIARRKGIIYVLVRKESGEKYQALRTRLGLKPERLVMVHGDVTKPMLGVRKETLAKMRGKIRHFVHLAAHYDIMSEDEAMQVAVNVEGTREAVRFAEAVQVKCFHHVSSVAVAGLYKGYWREDMFEEAEEFNQPYFRTKRLAERIVREECKIPFRIYRPGVVVGHSQTGEITKIDGPYLIFKFLQKLRKVLPPWLPVVGLEGGRINMVPVDFVAAAMDFLMHKPGLNGRTFHLVDPEPFRTGEALNLFAKASHGPQFAVRVDARMIELIPKTLRETVLDLPPIRRMIDTILRDLGIPRETFTYLNYPTRFDCRDTMKALEGSGIQCPRLDTYAYRLWDYWERNLDPDLFRDRSLTSAVKGKVVVVTGASSGIGRAAAIKLAGAGAKVCLVARTVERLAEVQAEIRKAGGHASVYPADLTDLKACDTMLARVREDHGPIDILVNNAGRSIRRSIRQSYDRFHDYERTMQLNYFAPVRLILGVLPSMAERRQGIIVNVSTLGVLATPPRFSAYVASKSALDAFSKVLQAEFLDKDISVTTINMPLVRTPMIDPTPFYRYVPAMTPEEAADLICDAIIDKPKRIATRLGIFAQIMTSLLPSLSDTILNTAYKLFPDTAPTKEAPSPEEQEPSPEAVIFASIMRGIYW